MHKPNEIACAGPEDAHAFDGIAFLPRSGNLDKPCPTCHGHGQWNSRIDLASFRSVRAICDHCDGRGWVETGHDLVPFPDIVMTPQGYPCWIVRFHRP